MLPETSSNWAKERAIGSDWRFACKKSFATFLASSGEYIRGVKNKINNNKNIYIKTKIKDKKIN
jgi:hypothetical protein